MGVERLFFSKNAQRPSPSARPAASSCRRPPSTTSPSARRPRTRSRSPSPAMARGQGAGRADGRSDPRARRRADARRCRRRPRRRDLHRQPRAGRAARSGRAVLDRSAIAPITRGETAYDRAVREALARKKTAARATSPARRATGDRRSMASWAPSRPIRSSSSSAGSASRVRLAGRPVDRPGRRPAEAVHPPPRARGPAGAVIRSLQRHAAPGTTRRHHPPARGAL